jgi:cytochrome c oxidase assembly protein subunit 15
MAWAALSLVYPQRTTAREPSLRGPRRFAGAVALLVFVMMLTGGFVAGIRAGFAYNTFPLMNGHVIPPEIMMIDPWWKNFFYNMATVQFDHRLVAWLLAIVVPLLWWRIHQAAAAPSRARRGTTALVALLALQIALGIATLLLVVPLPLAALHQSCAVLVFAAAINVAHALR